MSHFAVLIIGENPEKQLTPFDENLEMPRFMEYSKEQLIEKERQKIKDYENGTYANYLKDKEAYKLDCHNEAHLKYLENEFPKKLKFNDAELYEEAIKYYQPDEIGENGEVYSTQNPNSKWDWYKLGGRYAGTLKVKKSTKSLEPNFSYGWDEEEKEKVIKDNRTDSAKKKDIVNLDEISSFAVIKDGKWYEKGEMGWWGITTNEKEDGKWKDEFKKLIDGLPDDTLLSMYDCHI